MITDSVLEAIQKNSRYLFSVQKANGSWEDRLSSSPMATSAALITLHLANKHHYAAEITQGANWLRQIQHDDGSWADGVVNLGSLHSTAFAIASLQIINPEESTKAITQGIQYIEKQGGIQAIENRNLTALRQFCLLLLSMSNLYQSVPQIKIPLEIVYLPIWIRNHLFFSLSTPPVLAWGLKEQFGFFRQTLIDLAAKPMALSWLKRTQALDGGIEDSPLITAIIAMALIDTNIGPQIVNQCLSYLLKTKRSDGSWANARSLELSVTTYIIMGMDAAGILLDPRLIQTQKWVLEAQKKISCFETGSPSGGWSWSLSSSAWPETDDTSCAILILSRMGLPNNHPQISAGVKWLLKMQNKDGSWGTFVHNGVKSYDQSSPGLTGHVLWGLHQAAGFTATHSVVQRAFKYLARIQRSDGAIHDLWFRDFVFGTSSVLEAYSRFSLVNDPTAIACQRWLLTNQNDDGSWGGLRGQDGTVEETAWAISALLHSDISCNTEQIQKAILWIVHAQLPNGSWTPSVIGIYSRLVYYSSDHIANGFALKALSLFIQKQKEL